MICKVEDDRTPKRSDGRWTHRSMQRRSTQAWAKGGWELIWHLAFIGISLIVLLGLLLYDAELALASCAAPIIGQARIRETYRLNVRVDPKINAFLLMEKARTGMTISEVVETVFREYQRHRKELSSSLERRKD